MNMRAIVREHLLVGVCVCVRLNAFACECACSLRDEYLDEAGVAAGGGGVHGGPQLVVLGVDASSLAEQDLHHLLIVVNATLGGGDRSQ